MVEEIDIKLIVMEFNKYEDGGMGKVLLYMEK